MVKKWLDEMTWYFLKLPHCVRAPCKTKKGLENSISNDLAGLVQNEQNSLSKFNLSRRLAPSSTSISYIIIITYNYLPRHIKITHY